MSGADLMPGTIMLALPGPLMIEVIVAAPLLDVGFGEKLNMEGGRTGQHVVFRPSAVKP